MLGDDARRDLQNEAADLLADGHVVGFHPVEDALARRGVGYVFAAGQRRAERAALRRMLALGLEEERVLAPDVAAAVGAERLVDLGDLGRRRDRIADHAAAYVAHHFGDGAVAMDDGRVAGYLLFIEFVKDLQPRGLRSGIARRSSTLTPFWSWRSRGTDNARHLGLVIDLSQLGICFSLTVCRELRREWMFSQIKTVGTDRSAKNFVRPQPLAAADETHESFGFHHNRARSDRTPSRGKRPRPSRIRLAPPRRGSTACRRG